jgi:hypothetical protein
LLEATPESGIEEKSSVAVQFRLFHPISQFSVGIGRDDSEGQEGEDHNDLH